jgi:exonuclease VII large subunit
MSLQQEIATVSQAYLTARQKKVEELNKVYEELTKKDVDIEKRIKELKDWTSKMKKVLLNMDKEHVARMKELNERLKYLLSIEKLNESQEDVSKYIYSVLDLVDIRLVDSISLEEIERVRSFQSKEIPEQEKQLLMKK